MNTKTPRKIRVAMTYAVYCKTLAKRLMALEFKTGFEWCGSWAEGVATLEPIL